MDRHTKRRIITHLHNYYKKDKTFLPFNFIKWTLKTFKNNLLDSFGYMKIGIFSLVVGVGMFLGGILYFPFSFIKIFTNAFVFWYQHIKVYLIKKKGFNNLIRYVYKNSKIN